MHDQGRITHYAVSPEFKNTSYPERHETLCERLVQEALNLGGAAPTVLNAANEVAVAAFLDRKIGFGGIARLVEATMESMVRSGSTKAPANVDEALSVDHDTRNKAVTLLPQIALKAS